MLKHNVGLVNKGILILIYIALLDIYRLLRYVPDTIW